MQYKVNKNNIEVILPSKNKGKFRYKKRSLLQEYGKGFATRIESFDEQTYIEWQIGYDVLTSKILKKPTKLTDITFIDSKGKKKHPYELSELLFLALENNLLNINKLTRTLEEIKKFTFLLEDNYTINLESFKEFLINNLSFFQSDIILPNFFHITKDEIYIEVAMEKQQYASGIQPMVYVSIPIKNFANYKKMLNKTSKDIEEGIFIINKNNANILLDIFKIFGMCSKKHQQDVIVILISIIKKFQLEYEY